MKLRNLVGDRFKERPSDGVIDSHAFSVRGGYIKYVANGIFSLYPPMKRITKKIENIIREEMDAIDGQEVLFPVALPGSLWEESGRFESVGEELLRFKDRNDSQMVLGMTQTHALRSGRHVMVCTSSASPSTTFHTSPLGTPDLTPEIFSPPIDTQAPSVVFV